MKNYTLVLIWFRANDNLNSMGQITVRFSFIDELCCLEENGNISQSDCLQNQTSMAHIWDYTTKNAKLYVFITVPTQERQGV